MSERKDTSMMRGWMGVSLSASLALGTASRADAAGYQLNEFSAAATGRGDSVCATANEPSSIFYNPAGLTQTEGTEFEVGVSFVRPHASYTGSGIPSANATGGVVQQETDTGFVPAPNAYVTRALSSKAFVGFGFYTPYGLKLGWENPQQFVGRTLTHETDLRTYFLTPAIALKLSDIVSVAVGVSLVPATAYLSRTLGSTDNNQVLFPASVYGSEGRIELAASAFGVGANAGVQLTFDQLRVGFTFRSAVDLAFTGKVHFVLPNTVPSEIRRNFPDGDASADLTLPHSFTLGVGWLEGPLAVEASAQLTLWQSFDVFRVDFANQLPSPSLIQRRDWKNVVGLRLGGQYQLSDLFLRAGVGYDFTPVPDSTLDPTLPDANRLYFTIGLGYDFGVLRADAAYMLLILPSRDVVGSVNFPSGRFDGGTINLIGASLLMKI